MKATKHWRRARTGHSAPRGRTELAAGRQHSIVRHACGTDKNPAQMVAATVGGVQVSA
jgi:hypothetical protein